MFRRCGSKRISCSAVAEAKVLSLPMRETAKTSEQLVVPRAAITEEIVEEGVETVEEVSRLRPKTAEGLVVYELILRMENWNKARFNKGKIEFSKGISQGFSVGIPIDFDFLLVGFLVVFSGLQVAKVG